MEFVPNAAYACFLLHNYCENQKDYDIDGEKVQANEDDRINQPDSIYSCNTEEGEYIRDNLTNYIQENLPEH